MALTHKQEKFAQLVASGLTQSAAYRQAYDVSPDTLPATVVQDASHLAAHPNVFPRIQELRQAALAKMTSAQAWNLDRMVSEAETNLEMSRTWKQLGSANGALEIIGRATGILSDKPRDPTPVRITRVVVMLNDGRTQPVPELPGGIIVDVGEDENLLEVTALDNDKRRGGEHGADNDGL